MSMRIHTLRVATYDMIRQINMSHVDNYTYIYNTVFIHTATLVEVLCD